MLSNLVEGNKVKCEEYWPKSVKQPSEYGPYIVQILSEELFSNFVIRNMEIVVRPNSESKSEFIIIQFSIFKKFS